MRVPLAAAAVAAVLMAECVSTVAATSHTYNVSFDGQVIVCETDPRICEEGGSGTVLPTPDEYKWAKPGRIVLYAIILAYLFAGVAVLSDAFMNSIETITAADRTLQTVDLRGRPVQYSVRVWNPTVANLTLMALGSSAPEIILSIVEVMFNDFYAGDLGPGTIVGSAAFNLFIIVGACSYALGPTVKSIDAVGVYAVTAVFAVGAYVWLIVILEGTSPNVVEIWEAVATLLWFPVLVVVAYVLDTRRGRGSRQVAPDEEKAVITLINAAHETDVNTLKRHSLHAKIRELRDQIDKADHEPADTTMPRISQESIDLAVLARVFEAEGGGPPTRAYYRRMAKKMRVPKATQAVTSVGKGVNTFVNVGSEVGFASVAFAASYAEKHVDIVVERDGHVDRSCVVAYRTNDHVARGGRDFEAVEGTIEFAPGETAKTISIKILPVDEQAKLKTAIDEHDDTFTVELLNVRLDEDDADEAADEQVEAAEGELVALRNSVCTVHLATSLTPGCLQLECPEYKIMENTPGGTVRIKVLRTGGVKGEIGINYATRDGTAIAPSDYIPQAGTLTFADGECEKVVEVPIVNDDIYEDDEKFYFAISAPTGGARLGRMFESAIIIMNDDPIRTKLDRIKYVLRYNEHRLAQIGEKWREQLSEAVERPEDGVLSLAGLQWALVLPWSVVAAVLPPPTLGGGWVLFTMTLLSIGGVTALVGDVAALLGCCLGLSDYVTAITIVALGTSLPDTFASVLAAKTDKNADAAIVNVTGSNSVNVFLGLGIAWTICALRWEGHATDSWRVRIACRDVSIVQQYPDGVFYVNSGIFSYSVAVYSVCATVTLVYMAFNRSHFGGEIGGPRRALFFAGNFALWCVYIGLSWLKSEDVL